MAQYVYSMHRVGKIVPPNRQILKNISLSFFPGAKIGVLGLNGSGKSTFLKILNSEIQPNYGSVSIENKKRISVLKQNHFQYDNMDKIS